MAIDGIAAGGDGVGRVDGMAVFVPRTAPGDAVQVAYTIHGRHGRGRLLQVLEPSPQRVQPRCPHYEQDRCGGCQLQHLEATSQRRARQQIVQDTLRRVGRREIALPPITADLEWHYRERLTLTLRRRGSGWVAGLHPHDDPLRVFELERCEIAHPLLVETWLTLRSVLVDRSLALPNAEVLRVSLRLGEAHGTTPSDGNRPVVIVVQGGRTWPARERWATRVQELAPQLSGVWWAREDGAYEGLAADAGGDMPHTSDTPSADEWLPDATEALAFAQVNARVAEALREHVFAAVMDFDPHLVVDGYAGTGLLTQRVASVGREVIAVEADAVGARRATERVQAMGPAVEARARVLCDLMEQALPELVAPDRTPDVVVLNPPRRGVDARVTTWLESATLQAARGIVYVSCDPATLARDLSRLPSWEIVSVQCFDMFPQTAHVETVCVLQRSEGREAA